MSDLFRNPVQDFVDKLQDDRRSTKEIESLVDSPEFCRSFLQDLGKNDTIGKQMINTKYAASMLFVNHAYGV